MWIANLGSIRFMVDSEKGANNVKWLSITRLPVPI